MSVLIDAFGEEIALKSSSAELCERPQEVPVAAEREGVYEVRRESANRVYIFHGNQWYDTGRAREYLYGWHNPPHMTPKEMEALKILHQAGLNHMISEEGRRAILRDHHQSELRNITREQRLFDVKEM